MTSNTSRKATTKTKKFPDGSEEAVQLGRAYELDDGRVGTVKFIGRTFFKAGVEWIGLELTKGEGKNNGTVQGTDYFNCKKGKGVFVQLDKIKDKASGKSGKTVKSDVKKDGAIATGRSGYDAAKFETTDSGGFLAEKNVAASVGGEVAKKDGAIATGRADYDAAEFETKDDGGDFLAEKNDKASEGGEVAKKEGPIEARAEE